MSSFSTELSVLSAEDIHEEVVEIWSGLLNELFRLGIPEGCTTLGGQLLNCGNKGTGYAWLSKTGLLELNRLGGYPWGETKLLLFMKEGYDKGLKEVFELE